jgi:hypothetical protein
MAKPAASAGHRRAQSHSLGQFPVAANVIDRETMEKKAFSPHYLSGDLYKSLLQSDAIN